MSKWITNQQDNCIKANLYCIKTNKTGRGYNQSIKCRKRISMKNFLDTTKSQENDQSRKF